MRAGLYQFCPKLGDKASNLRKVEDALSHAKADIIVLPELFSTGYCFGSREDVARWAEDASRGETISLLTRLAQTTGAAIVAGIVESSSSKLYNSAVLVPPDGNVRAYRKIHLFSREKLLFDPGTEPPPVCLVGSARVSLLVCFDYFFPELARTVALAGAQVICHPANLVLEYAQQITVTRAIENRVFWILGNRTGSEGAGGQAVTFTGRSQIVDPDGRVLFRAGSDDEILKIVEIDPGLADNKKVGNNDLFQDRRPETYRV